MAYVYIDNDGLPAVDDEQWSSVAWKQLRDNLGEVWAERGPTAPVSYGAAGGDRRLCSAWPVSWGPYWIRIPEPQASLTLRVRIDCVENQSVWLYATCAKPYDRVSRPPGDRTAWAEQTTTTSEYTADIAVANYRGQAGWVQVHLWTLSEIVNTAEETGSQIDRIERRGGVELTGSSVVPIGTYPVERVLIMGSSATSQDADSPEGPIYQICGWTNGTEKLAWTVPVAISSITTSTLATWAVHKLGVIDVLGMMIEGTPRAVAAPGVPAYYIDEPCSEIAHIGLVSAVIHTIDKRLPTWSARPARVQVTSGVFVDWLIRAGRDGGGHTLLDESTAQVVASTIVNYQSPDKNGHVAILSACLFRDTTREWDQQDVRYRLRAAQFDGSELATGSWSTFRSPLTWIQDMLHPPTLAHDVWGSIDVNEEWQFRGALHGQGASHGLDLISEIELEIDETDITYPCVLQIQALLPAAINFDVAHVTVGAGFAARGL